MDIICADKGILFTSLCISMGERKETEMTFNDLYTGERKKFWLYNGDTLTSFKCPLDETPLIHSFGHNSFEYETEHLYCPNCNEKFYSMEKEYIAKRKKQIVKDALAKFKEIVLVKSRLEKIIELGGRHE